jgi:hypothetical protein
MKELIKIRERTDTEPESLIADVSLKELKQRVCKNRGQPDTARRLVRNGNFRGLNEQEPESLRL